MNSAVLSKRMSPVADALIAKSKGKYDPEAVRTLVAKVASEFDGARVQDYVEVLVTKQVADTLRKLDALQAATA